MSINFSDILADVQKAPITYSAIEISYTAPDGAKTTVTVKPEQLGPRSGTLPGPAELDPASPEAEVRHLFDESYGDGSLIPLSKDDPDFATKSAALKAANRRFDGSAKGWIRK